MGGHFLGESAPPTRLATPFGGGIGSTHQDLCGAISGGVMVIGALHGRERPDQAREKEHAAALAARYRDGVLTELGETRCQPLRDRYHGTDGSGTCAPVVERAATVLIRVLSETEVSGNER